MKNLHHQLQLYKYIVLIASAVLFTMISCSPAQKETKPEVVQKQNQVPQTILKSDTPAIISTAPLAVKESAPATVLPNTAAITGQPTTPPKLNPAHGQPFHRCDIPVGSPLNGAPATAQTPSQRINRTGTSPTLANAARLNNQQSNNSSAPAVTNATTTPPKLNPPHGQPFHRCEIPVGSPLN